MEKERHPVAAVVLAPLLPAHPRVEDLTSAGGAVVGGKMKMVSSWMPSFLSRARVWPTLSSMFVIMPKKEAILPDCPLYISRYFCGQWKGPCGALVQI